MEIAALLCSLVAMLCSILVLVQLSKQQAGDASGQNRIGERLGAMEHNLEEQQKLTHSSVMGQMHQLEERFRTLETVNDQRMEALRMTMQQRMEQLQTDNNRRLEHIRTTVDEQLQQTLTTRMNESFRLVNDRLEQVYKGLGEMQTIAAGVGDLKKVLSNVKTRGILGELQLGAILDEILAPEQYACEIPTIPGSRDHVEFAVRLPGNAPDQTVYLPIDSKFPGDTYAALQDAYTAGDPEQIAAAKRQLETVLKKCAKDISEKYIMPPHTTRFAILFLPFEGLYAEVVNSGLPELLQRQYNVNIAGPSTMAATLNALQMGFRTLAIQQRSDQVWQILGEVKSEFETFSSALAETQKHIKRAEEDLEKLVGVRTRQMNRKLRNVESTELPLSGGSDLP